MKVADARVRPFILAMRYSGLRISDVTVLPVSALTVSHQPAKAGSRLRLYTAKTGEPVSVLIPEDVANALRGVQHKNPQYFF